MIRLNERAGQALRVIVTIEDAQGRIYDAQSDLGYTTEKVQEMIAGTTPVPGDLILRLIINHHINPLWLASGEGLMLGLAVTYTAHTIIQNIVNCQTASDFKQVGQKSSQAS